MINLQQNSFLRVIPHGSATIQSGSGGCKESQDRSQETQDLPSSEKIEQDLPLSERIEQDLISLSEIDSHSSDSSCYSSCESPNFYPIKEKQIEAPEIKIAKKRKTEKKNLPPNKKLKQNYSFTIID